ncbi:MAG: hypothetical protein Q9227_008275 [Pyrenula ochraceoflavens]
MKRKLLLSMVFAIGGLTCIISAIRTVSLVQINFKDATYSFIPGDGWTIAEVNLSIICASLPTLPAIFRYWHHRYRTISVPSPPGTRFSGGKSGKLSRKRLWWSRRRGNGSSNPSSDREKGHKPSDELQIARGVNGENVGYLASIECSHDEEATPMNPIMTAARVHVRTDVSFSDADLCPEDYASVNGKKSIEPRVHVHP